jgi:hypothetical protein
MRSALTSEQKSVAPFLFLRAKAQTTTLRRDASFTSFVFYWLLSACARASLTKPTFPRLADCPAGQAVRLGRIADGEAGKKQKLSRKFARQLNPVTRDVFFLQRVEWTRTKLILLTSPFCPTLSTAHYSHHLLFRPLRFGLVDMEHRRLSLQTHR